MTTVRLMLIHTNINSPHQATGAAVACGSMSRARPPASADWRRRVKASSGCASIMRRCLRRRPQCTTVHWQPPQQLSRAHAIRAKTPHGQYIYIDKTATVPPVITRYHIVSVTDTDHYSVGGRL